MLKDQNYPSPSTLGYIQGKDKDYGEEAVELTNPEKRQRCLSNPGEGRHWDVDGAAASRPVLDPLLLLEQSPWVIRNKSISLWFWRLRGPWSWWRQKGRTRRSLILSKDSKAVVTSLRFSDRMVIFQGSVGFQGRSATHSCG